MGTTKIEWADAVWNPVTGCTKVSAGCANCYAERMHGRFSGYAFNRIELHDDRLYEPLHWRRPRRVFVCSMSDLFHEQVPMSFIGEVLCVARALPRHTFMFLTKRPERMRQALIAFDCDGGCNGLPCGHLWFGVSVENQAAADERIPVLVETPAAVRFVSVEPMLDPVDLSGWLTRPQWGEVNQRGTRPYEIVGRADLLNWIICGGESGPGARPMHPEWARSLRDQCAEAGVPFFFKQWGEWAPGVQSDDVWCRRIYDWPDGVTSACRVGKKAAGRLLDGREWNEFPR